MKILYGAMPDKELMTIEQKKSTLLEKCDKRVISHKGRLPQKQAK